MVPNQVTRFDPYGGKLRERCQALPDRIVPRSFHFIMKTGGVFATLKECYHHNQWSHWVHLDITDFSPSGISTTVVEKQRDSCMLELPPNTPARNVDEISYTHLRWSTRYSIGFGHSVSMEMPQKNVQMNDSRLHSSRHNIGTTTIDSQK